MLLLVGLGNPGQKYESNRHNIGFMMADDIVRHYGFSVWRSKFQGLVADGTIGGEKVLILKPQTFMNKSGQSVGEIMRFYKLTPDQIIVMHDELDLVPGKVRVKQGGGHGGNNGVRDIDAHIGADFRRIRVGVGHPGNKNVVANYLLSDFAKADKTWLEPVIDECTRALPYLIEGANDKFMSEVARHTGQTTNNKASEDGI